MKKLFFSVMTFLSFSMNARDFYHDGGEYPISLAKAHADLFVYQRSDGKPGAVSSCNCQQNDMSDPNFFPNILMNFQALRAQFPVLKQTVKGFPILYFDSASTAQMPISVCDAMIAYYQTFKSNAGRGLYEFAAKTTDAVENARWKVAQFVGAQKKEIVFTPNATLAINLVIHIWAEKNLQAGDEIVISEVEHNANFIPWMELAKRIGVVIKRVPLNDQGVVTSYQLKQFVSDKTKLVAITHQSNILGTVNDIASLAKVAHGVGAKILVDAAQSVAHHRIDVQAMECDFLAFSGHKLFGPTGIGVLFINQNIFDQCCMVNFGGGIVYGVTLDNFEYKPMPHCLEAGTPSIAEIIGLGAAIDFVRHNINFDQAVEHETKMAKKLITALQDIPEVTIISSIPDEQSHTNIVTFFHSKIDSYDLSELLDTYGIAVRAGYHCVQPYHDAVESPETVRFSFSVYNTEQEVDFCIACLKKIFATL